MIGIMADSHDNLGAIRKAVETLNQNDVSTVLHAGDLISPFTAPEFNKLEAKFEAVYGNNDGEREGLKTAYQELCTLDDFKKLKLDGLCIAIYHGTQVDYIEALKDCGKYDLLVRGHTHKVSIVSGDTLEINPGETCGYLSGRKTVVIMDTDRLDCKIIEI
jgi:putative phosphoesterase